MLYMIRKPFESAGRAVLCDRGFLAQAIGKGKKRRKPKAEVFSGEKFGRPFN